MRPIQIERERVIEIACAAWYGAWRAKMMTNDFKADIPSWENADPLYKENERRYIDRLIAGGKPSCMEDAAALSVLRLLGLVP